MVHDNNHIIVFYHAIIALRILVQSLCLDLVEQAACLCAPEPPNLSIDRACLSLPLAAILTHAITHSWANLSVYSPNTRGNNSLPTAIALAPLVAMYQAGVSTRVFLCCWSCRLLLPVWQAGR